MHILLRGPGVTRDRPTPSPEAVGSPARIASAARGSHEPGNAHVVGVAHGRVLRVARRVFPSG